MRVTKTAVLTPKGISIFSGNHNSNCYNPGTLSEKGNWIRVFWLYLSFKINEKVTSRRGKDMVYQLKVCL